MKKLCYVATIPHVVFSFLSNHIRKAASSYDVSVVSHSHGAELLYDLPIHYVSLPFERKISLWKDFATLCQLTRLFRREQFAIVHSIMPKTGFLSMLSGWLARVPFRIHTFTGQVWATQHGFRRTFLKLFDKLIVKFATHILVDSFSQRQFLIKEGVLGKDQGIVIGEGSICGVDPERFCPDFQIKANTRADLGIDFKDTLILFLGRLNRDKGILELAEAFSTIAACRKNVFLLLIGSEEDVDYEHVKLLCGKNAANLRRVLFTSEPQKYMAAADIFCLPSYREGFGQVVIEAAACEVPTVATRIYGIIDAVVENETGLLVSCGDSDLLAESLLKLIDDPELRIQLGKAARKRVVEHFSSNSNSDELVSLYKKLIDQM